MRIDFIQMLLQQGLLGENGILDDQLKQAGDVVGIQMVAFPQRYQTLRRLTPRGRYHEPDGAMPALLYRPLQPVRGVLPAARAVFIQCADLIAQSQ